MSRLSVILLISVISCFTIPAKTITGRLSELTNQEIRLKGLNGLKTYPISSTQIDTRGEFKLYYSESDYGAGHVNSADEKRLFVILSGEDIEIEGEEFKDHFLYTNTTTLCNNHDAL